MVGLPTTTDWARFTRENRLLDVGKTYKSIVEPWQTEIDNGIARCPRTYLQLPRGHDKTERYAWWSLLWLETTQACRGYAAGVDRDNAKLFRDAAKKLKALHPHLFNNIEVEKHTVFSKETGSYIETISSDVNSAYGLNFDLLIVNDFHAWDNYEFWEVLWTACEKRPDIRVWMESNALTLGTPGAEWVSRFRKWVSTAGVRSLVRGTSKPEWFYFNPPKFLATWQAHKLEQWKATLLPSTYRRLIDNQDMSGQESFVTEDQVAAITTLPGPSMGRYAERGAVVTSVDLGLRKDCTAVASVQLLPSEKIADPKNPNKFTRAPQRVHLLALDVIVGNVDEPVQIDDAEKLAFLHRERYKAHPIICDPWQAIAMVQRHPGICEEWKYTGGSVAQLTSILYRMIADGNLRIYPEAGRSLMSDGEDWDLQKELTHAVVKPMSYGDRVDHRSGGFADRLMAVGMACHRLLGGVLPRAPVVKVEEKPVQPAWLLEKLDAWDAGPQRLQTMPVVRIR